jgi:hypothetical protein
LSEAGGGDQWRCAEMRASKLEMAFREHEKLMSEGLSCTEDL